MTILDLSHLTYPENIRFNEMAFLIRKEFNEIVEQVSTPYVHDIHWVVGSIASRNKYTSLLFMRLCSLAFIKNECESRQDITMVILTDKQLAGVLSEYFQIIKTHTKVKCTETFFKQFWDFLRPIRQYSVAIIEFSLRYLGSRFKNPVGKLSLDRPITLIDTFVLNNKAKDEGSLVNGEYKDRYYPGLLEHLTEDERQDVFFLPTIIGFKNPIACFNKIRKAGTRFLVHDDFLKLSDYLFVLLHPFCMLRRKIPVIYFRGFNITSLLKQENKRNCSDQIGLLGLLYYRFARRLSEKKVPVRLLLEWYENQVIDRGMIVGFHRFHPNTKVIGYQGYVIAQSLHLYTCPNMTEWLGKAVPDIVYVVGKGLKENLFEFCKELRVEVAPGFRFQKLWRERRYYPSKDFFTILVGLPINLEDSSHILQLIFDGLAELNNQGIRFWVKPHPTWSPERIKQLLPSWPSSFEFKIGDFHEAIEGSNLLISNASSVSLEALAKRVPVIVVGARSGVTQNPIPETISQDIWSLAYTSDECVLAIKKFKAVVKDNIKNSEKISSRIKEDFFEPVNREKILNFLDL